MRGACRCGQLSYQVNTQPLYMGYCHCKACQKRNSAPCVGLFLIEKKDITIDGQSDSYKSVGGSGVPMIEHRCRDCGNAIYSDLKVLKDVLVFLSSSLEDSQDFQAEGHLWVSSKDPRFDIVDDLPQQSGPPLQMLPFLAKPPQ